MPTDSYKKLGYQWEDYSRSLDRVAETEKELRYDPFVVVTPVERGYFENKATSLETQLFLLPNSFGLLSLDQLTLLPNDVPDFPELPIAPPLVADKSAYPDWYFRSTESRVKLGYQGSFYENDIETRQLLVAKAKAVQASIDKLKNEFNSVFQNARNGLSSFRRLLNEGSVPALEKLISISNEKHPLPEFLRREFRVAIDTQSQIALVEFKFPDYSDLKLVVGHTGKYSYNAKPKYATPTQAKKYVRQCLYSLMIRSAYLAANACIKDAFKSVVVNVDQDWFDPATGAPRTGPIASLQAPVDYLRSLDLEKLDPEACFKYLKGINTPSFQNISPIRPIFVLNRNDERFIDGKEVANQLEPETNLASIPWEDFEHLVAQLFEWEFKQKGMEIKVTRASRDRGVDAILFDPDPLRGGKYVLQAKRYTRTVDVSAVRDLYGTLMNEGANRGILITTSSFGPDAYEFVKDKPISLVDGSNLILMLQKHGRKYRIDLEEARSLNVE